MASKMFILNCHAVQSVLKK